jgi:hypothetical protein
MPRHGGDDLQRIQIPAAERDRLIVELRRRGWTYARIGKTLGMSGPGVRSSLIRIQQGRPGADSGILGSLEGSSPDQVRTSGRKLAARAMVEVSATNPVDNGNWSDCTTTAYRQPACS